MVIAGTASAARATSSKQTMAVATEAPLHLLSISQDTDLRTQRTVTVKEAAFRLGKSPDSVYQWLRVGRLHGIQPGGRGCAILILEDSVRAALSHRAGRRFSPTSVTNL